MVEELEFGCGWICWPWDSLEAAKLEPAGEPGTCIWSSEQGPGCKDLACARLPLCPCLGPGLEILSSSHSRVQGVHCFLWDPAATPPPAPSSTCSLSPPACLLPAVLLPSPTTPRGSYCLNVSWQTSLSASLQHCYVCLPTLH